MTRFKFEYSKFEFLSENIANRNIQYFAAPSLDSIFNLSLYKPTVEKRLPDITCSWSRVDYLDISNDALYELIKDHIGLTKYRNNYFAYDTDRKIIVHIKSNYLLLTYLFVLTHSMCNYFSSVILPSMNLILYKIEDYKFEILR